MRARARARVCARRRRERERNKAEPVTHTDGGATRDTNDAERRFPAECTARPARSAPEGATERRRARARACSNTTERRDTIEGSDERGEGERQTGPASRPGGTQGVCLCVCARADDSCVSLSWRVTARYYERGRAREAGRLGDVTETDGEPEKEGEKKNAGEERKSPGGEGETPAVRWRDRRRTDATRYDIPARISPECGGTVDARSNRRKRDEARRRSAAALRVGRVGVPYPRSRSYASFLSLPSARFPSLFLSLSLV